MKKENIMRFWLTLIFCLLVAPVWAQQSKQINGLNPAGTLQQSDIVPIWQGGPQAVRTTAGAIAALSGGGSSGSPGGLSTQVQYNNGGVFGGLSTILYVQAFGAKCDGHILQTGIINNANSNDISSYDYQFVTADIGATITLTNGVSNNPPNLTNHLTTTISNVSGGHALLAVNVPWSNNTGGGAYAGTSARWYHTDDTVAIQNALNAGAAISFMAPGAPAQVGGGNIRFPTGVCVGHGLTFYANQTISGETAAGSIVMQPANANDNVFISYGFPPVSPAPTNQYTANGVAFQYLTIDGNRGANTGSGFGLPSGTGACIRWYGNSKRTEEIRTDYCAGDGLFLGGGSSGGVPFYTFYNASNPANGLGYANGFEDHLNNVQSWYNGGWGVVDAGAGDSEITNMWISGNNTGGLLDESISFAPNSIYNGSPLKVQNYHAYQNTNGLDIDIETASFQCEDCDLEDGGTINAAAAFYNTLSRGSGTFHIGKVGSSGISGSRFINSNIANLNIPTGAVPNNGAGDIWVNSSVSNITGNAYAPNNVFMSSGFGYQKINVGASGSGPLQLSNCGSGSGACTGSTQLNTSSTGVYTEATGTGSTFTPGLSIDANQNVALGPNASNSGASAGAGIDAHFLTSTFVMPSGTLAQRPACVGAIAGGIRFDITTGNMEICAGNGSWANVGTGTVSLSTPNQFTAGQSVVPVTVPINTVVHYTPNLQLGNNFTVTLSHSACPCTLDNPANMIAGQSGWIIVIQSGSGSDTIGTYGSQYKFSGGTPPTLSTGANAVDVLSYTTLDTTHILINPSLNFH